MTTALPTVELPSGVIEYATYGPDEPGALDWQRLEEATLELARGLTAPAGGAARA